MGNRVMGAMMAQDREIKLPVWAQTLILDLRRLVRQADREADQAALATGPDDSDTVITRFYPGREVRPVGLGRGTKVTFRLPSGDVDVRVNERGRLHIATDSQLVAHSVTGNVIEVWNEQ